MSIIATKSGASTAGRRSGVYQSRFLSNKAIQYKLTSTSPGLLGAITSLISKRLCSRKVSQLLEKESTFQKKHGQLRLFTGNGTKLRRLLRVQIFSKKKAKFLKF
jgi:hypothetical protein